MSRSISKPSEARRTSFLVALSMLATTTGCGDVPIAARVDADGGAPSGEEKVIHGDRDTSLIFPWVADIEVPLHSSSCTATIVSEHYLLTAAHCVNGVPEDTVRADVTIAGGTRSLYQNAPAELFVHPDAAIPLDDIALIHVRGAVMTQDVDRRASFYTDARSPFDPGERDFVFFAGYGQGTDYGGSSTCSTAPFNVLRWSGARLTEQGTGRIVRALGYNTSAACDGDSGMAFFLERDAEGEEGTKLAYAVHSSSSPTTLEMFANRIDDVHDFIGERMSATSVFPLTFVRDHRGYRSQRYVERAIGPRTIIGPGDKCMTATGMGAPVVLRTCDGSPSQQLTLRPSGAIEVQGMCIDILLAAGGGAVRTASCTPVSGAKLVGLTRDGRITGPSAPNTSLCIAARDGATADETQLVLTRCDGGPAEAWRWWDVPRSPRAPYEPRPIVDSVRRRGPTKR